MIAEDNAAMRETLGELLEEEGLDVVGRAVDGVHALALAEEHKPDLIIMDLRMPRMDGLEATKAVKQLLPGVRVLMLSAYADPGLSDSAREAGANGYIVKGSAYADLMEAIMVALPKPSETTTTS
jgi:response regulator NasT